MGESARRRARVHIYHPALAVPVPVRDVVIRYAKVRRRPGGADVAFGQGALGLGTAR
jgi:hypothetical protein